MTTFIPEPHLLGSPRHRPWPSCPVLIAPDEAAPPRLTPGPAAWAGPRFAEPPGSATPPATADVVIIGAGPAGLAMASALWHRGVRDMVLLDQAERPCGRFFDRIDVLRQRVLRSPYEHHPGVEGYRDCELLDFARLHWSLLTPVERGEVRMAQAGHRSVVPVDVFEAFCRHIATIHHVPEHTWKATARQVRPGGGEVSVRGSGFEITARYVVLCTGEERTPAPPAWWDGDALPYGVGYWDQPAPDGAERIVVVGAGLTAAQLLANALGNGLEAVWVFREARERYQCPDIDSAFFRPEGRVLFGSLAWDPRLALMRRQRKTSVMFEFRPLLQRAEADGRLSVRRGRAVAGIAPRPDGRPVVLLDSGERVAGDHVTLALGTTALIGQTLLPGHVVGARDGWPDLDERTLAYRRAPRVFAVGAAAGMALSPAARNIDGHRVATARVAAVVARGLANDGRPAVVAGQTYARPVAHD